MEVFESDKYDKLEQFLKLSGIWPVNLLREKLILFKFRQDGILSGIALLNRFEPKSREAKLSIAEQLSSNGLSKELFLRFSRERVTELDKVRGMSPEKLFEWAIKDSNFLNL